MFGIMRNGSKRRERERQEAERIRKLQAKAAARQVLDEQARQWQHADASEKDAADMEEGLNLLEDLGKAQEEARKRHEEQTAWQRDLAHRATCEILSEEDWEKLKAGDYYWLSTFYGNEKNSSLKTRWADVLFKQAQLRIMKGLM